MGYRPWPQGQKRSIKFQTMGEKGFYMFSRLIPYLTVFKAVCPQFSLNFQNKNCFHSFDTIFGLSFSTWRACSTVYPLAALLFHSISFSCKWNFFSQRVYKSPFTLGNHKCKFFSQSWKSNYLLSSTYIRSLHTTTLF